MPARIRPLLLIGTHFYLSWMLRFYPNEMRTGCDEAPGLSQHASTRLMGLCPIYDHNFLVQETYICLDPVF